MKKFFNEFKEFAIKGNMIDLAVGMIVGAAFTAVVNALVTNLFNPVIGLITGGIDLNNAWKVKIGETVVDDVVTPLTINFGAFVSALINFLIMAFVVFLFVKVVNKVREGEAKLKKTEEAEEEAPTTKICPFCKSEIAIDAVKCPHCTSDLPAEE